MAAAWRRMDHFGLRFAEAALFFLLREGIVKTRSRPVWARGLKQYGPGTLKLSPQSRPVWARGLKLHWPQVFGLILASRPVWARGLKHPAAP